LKIELKVGGRALAVWKGPFQVSYGLEQRIRLRALRRRLLAVKTGSQPLQTLRQLSAHAIERLQLKGQVEFFRRRLDRITAQQLEQP
jgi:hypothetical protein